MKLKANALSSLIHDGVNLLNWQKLAFESMHDSCQWYTRVAGT